MKSSSNSFVRTMVILLASATLGLAQTSGYNNGPSPYGSVHNNSQTVQAPESVRPGALNYVEGQVSADGQPLNPQSVGHVALQPNQLLETGNGYAEILLTPGAFLRVGPNSQISMTSIGLADTRFNLVRGNALVEADQMIDGTHLSVAVGNSTVEVLKKGLYSFDANQQAVRVLDGKLKVVGINTTREIGKHDQILTDSKLKKSDFNWDQAKHDPLYVWSEARSRSEANQNQMLAGKSYRSGSGSGWYWDPYANYYGFWPASAYLYSPFGFGFYGYPGYYGGFYPGYYGGYSRGYYGYRGVVRPGHIVGGVRGVTGFHGNSGVSAHTGGGFHSGGHR